MSTTILEILAVALIVFFAGGAWAAGRGQRSLTERDYHRAERWRSECAGKTPAEDAVLRSLDLALSDGREPPVGRQAETGVPSDGQKG